ncbi:hypothetical protein BDP27DRAFT_1436608 [Rhodocollybia butyracea]|uniref:Uncharacterized protein n=1 Tax=Rhodocollybia butyracea TaxID=206335 RepID=A0A9P5P6L3_9AGAR|nr:hypothetical protein BDP27DRAFT_1436608 [Rhodocollybia butyracea]
MSPPLRRPSSPVEKKIGESLNEPTPTSDDDIDSFTEDTGDAEVSDEENSSAAPDAPKVEIKKEKSSLRG